MTTRTTPVQLTPGAAEPLRASEAAVAFATGQGRDADQPREGRERPGRAVEETHAERNRPEHRLNRCPRQESNLRTRFRKPLLYPLSYGGSRPSE
jgi:hypothetical protein